LKGSFQSRLQIEEQSTDNFKDKLISQLLQLLINERQNNEELLWRYSRHNYNLENPNQPEKAIKNDEGDQQDDVGRTEYISLDQKRHKRFSE